VGLLVASASVHPLAGEPSIPQGVIHAYRSGADATLCGIALDELHVTEHAWSRRWPNYCALCDAVARDQLEL